MSVDEASQINRRLAAIVFADVAGYSRLMAINEAETVRRWKALRSEIMEPYVQEQGGRVAELQGDALLIEFPSAVNALRWAVDVQRTIKSRKDDSDADALSLRIGINVEDVIVEDDLLSGDGVNIAARIHQAAEPGQIVVTASVRDYVTNKLAVKFHDMGTPPFKNISRPVHVFAVDWAEPDKDDALRQPYLHWSSRPTVAVLPFRNVGGNEEDSYFGEGITEDIITGLSRSRSIYVIARTSTLRYSDRSVDLRQMAGELDVRNIMSPAIPKAAFGSHAARVGGMSPPCPIARDS